MDKGFKTYFKKSYRSLCVIALTFIAVPLWGQKMSVESFELIETDLTANTPETTKLDQNGDKCALIKIQTNLSGLSFDVGQLGIFKKEDQCEKHPGEIWLYVPHGVKNITIQHPQLGVINDYDLGMSVETGRTYRLKLTSDQVSTQVLDYEHEQVLRVRIEPKTAIFSINGAKHELDTDGTAEIRLAFGSHSYHVTADNYHPADGKIEINDKDKKQELNVKLKQAFGYLTLEATPETEMAEVYVDGNQIGKIPLNRHPIGSGKHSLTVRKKLYLRYDKNFEMTDSGSVKITPTLKPNYAEARVTVVNDKDARIYDNGELLGQGTWSGGLEAGRHTLGTQKVNHTGTVKEVEIRVGQKYEITLEKPVPITGSLYLSSNPSGAEVFIDKKYMGKTPFTNTAMLIGRHYVELQLKGYKNENLSVDIEEKKRTTRNVTLTDFCTATIYSEPNHANLSINGRQMGTTPYMLNLVAGQYEIEVSARGGYSPYHKKSMRLDGNTKDIHIKLHRNYVRENEFYMQAGYDVADFSAVNFGLGGYIHNFNLEGNYIYGLSKGEMIYWNDMTGEIPPFDVTYKLAHGANVKLGYGFQINSRIRITPQVGCQFIMLKDEYSLDKLNNATSVTAGARFNVALAPHLGLSVSPEYMWGVYKSDLFKELSEVSSKIKGYSDRFGCNVCINVFF